MIGTWNYPVRIEFGPGSISKLGAAATELGMKRPLFVTDPGLAKLDIAANARQVVRDSGLTTTLFCDIQRNPTGDDVARGKALFREAECDGVIAFGGGASLDVGKAIALIANQTLSLWAFDDTPSWSAGEPDKIVPCIGVPTTAGTGSEVGRASVIVDSVAQTKRIIFHPDMVPNRVIADPELTVGLPPRMTAAVGMDALSHNIEALLSPTFHPMGDGIALQGIRLVFSNLRRAVEDGSDIEARANMMAASTMGAVAFQKGLGVMHALAHPSALCTICITDCSTPS